MQVFTPPQKYVPSTKLSVFLAGSIEQGKAENWQEKVIQLLKDTDCNVYNPRRAKWDASLEQDISDPTFYEQVNWELDALDRADIIIMYFDPSTQSPITLLEFGMYVKSWKTLIIACPDGFWRKGNIQICCERADVPLLNTFDELVQSIKLTFKNR